MKARDSPSSVGSDGEVLRRRWGHFIWGSPQPRERHQGAKRGRGPVKAIRSSSLCRPHLNIDMVRSQRGCGAARSSTISPRLLHADADGNRTLQENSRVAAMAVLAVTSPSSPPCWVRRDRVGPLEVRQHHDVEQLGADSWPRARRAVWGGGLLGPSLGLRTRSLEDGRRGQGGAGAESVAEGSTSRLSETSRAWHRRFIDSKRHVRSSACSIVNIAAPARVETPIFV
jgi:hypothetical protein